MEVLKEYTVVIFSAFLALAGACMIYMATQISQISTSVYKMSLSVTELNTKIFYLVKDADKRAKKLNEHELRIRELERHR